MRRLAWLSEVSLALAGALEDLSPALERVGDLCVPEFCDLCLIDLVSAGTTSAYSAQRVAPGSGLAEGALAAARTEAMPHWPVLLGAEDREPEEAVRLCSRVGASWLIAVPISGRDGARGRVVLANGPRRGGLDASDLQVARDLAMRVATAGERVDLYRRSISNAHWQATVAGRLRRLNAAATALAGALSPGEVLQAACREACAVFEASAAVGRWSAPGSPELTASVVNGAAGDGAVGNGAVGNGAAGDPASEALAAGMAGAAAPAGWAAAALVGQDGQVRGSLALRSAEAPSSEDELLLASLASVVAASLERAGATEAWRRREGELDAMLEASPVAIVTVSAEGAVQAANRRARELFGWGSEEARPVFASGVRPAILEAVSESLSGTPVVDRPVSGDGLELVVGAACLHSDPDGGRSVLLTATDVTKERQAERLLLQAQRLEAMGQVAGGLAHDFNNLLTVIIGYSSILRRRLEGRAGLEIVDQLDQAVNRTAALTQKLLGFARRQSEEAVVVDLAGTVRQMGELLSGIAGEDVAVEVSVPEGPVAVLADPSALEQMVLNLAVNARDAMEGRGRLAVSVASADLDVRRAAAVGLPAGRYASLVVSDDGPGMTEEVRSRCLEPFFTTKGRGKGSGLGLPMVYGHAVAAGGTLAIDTSPGKGTTITVWLPLSDTEAEEAASPKASPDRPRLSGRVLLVCDEEGMRLMTRLALSEAGLEVVDVVSAEAALELREAHWDALVSEVVLPGMGGVELAARLRSTQPELPVLFVSGYASSQARHRDLLEGARFIRKPYRPEELCRSLAELLARKPEPAGRR